MSGGAKGKRGGAISHGEGGLNGQPRSKEYRAWLSMRKRCKTHPHYVKHGVKVHPAWESSYLQFVSDVGRAPSEAHTLDRYPNSQGNYEPGNVRWATTIEQRHNRRPGSRVSRPWLGKKRNMPRNDKGQFLAGGGQ